MAQNTLIVSNWKMNLNLINSTKLISKLKILKISKNIKNIICPQYLLCLLYTSPSPRDDELSRMPSSA